MGNGGECRQIHFICTKSDLEVQMISQQLVSCSDTEQTSKPRQVRAEFSKLKEVKKQFSEEDFKVFTVSSKEFLKKKRLDPDDTGDSSLHKFFYLSNKYADIKTTVCKELEKKLSHEHDREPVEETLTAFERCLSEGVEKSKSSCEKVLKSVLYPTKKGGSAFHRILKCVVQNGGIHKTKKGKSININMKLTSCLTDSIDEEFKKTFP
ncbi:hypothetical protein F7725_003443 [Dissostichus mawsoni]|uniref:Uncharacterized protein n=1 Tax=Dissostichus mawsoni TaxID=36200 RepID=A0A7J5YAC7_DISMA|nr:hypothetical protein F7725_003443 [Dissostichus mawsoni]